MFNNKYSKVLTVLLVIVIIGILGLLGFLGFDAFRRRSIENESQEVVRQFENEHSNQLANVEAIDPDIDLNSLAGETTANNGGKVVKYKGYDVIETIEIPKNDIKYPIIRQEDVGINSLKIAICNLYGELNEPGGNAVLIGHNYRNGTFFSNNKKLTKGDKIYITDNDGNKVTYIVYKKYETSTGDFDYATRKIGDKREISLSTCTDDSKRRLIIWAKEE